jgi:UDP-N-acetylmuramate--alanine ligase
MKLHFIGIGGIGTSALARYFLEKGHKISGSDLVSSEITDALKKSGVKIFIGHNPKCLTPGVKQVIYSPAVPKDNPELKKAFRLQTSNFKLRVLSYPEALGELTKKYFTIAVCGSHGKSTVTAMIGILLKKAGFDPTVIVGTKVREFGDSNCRVGKSKYLVIEADEHFASFLNYWPKIIVLTALEADHLDYYKNFKNYLVAFKKFIAHLPDDGILTANKDDKNTKKLLKICHNNFRTIGQKLLFFSMKQKEAKKIRKILKVPGEFNVSNALAVLAVARILKVPDKISFKALSEYKGTWRRFELVEADLRGFKRGSTRKITIISDYAHHPTQIRETLKAAREKFKNKKIWCVFQPHQYQRTFYLFDDFVKVFRKALQKTEDGPLLDKLIITDIYEVAGREDKEIKKKVNSEKLVKRIMNYELGIRNKIMYIPTIEKAADYLKKNLKGGEVVIVMGAGDIYKLCEQF